MPVKKAFDITTEWGDALLTAVTERPRPERLRVRLTDAEQTSLYRAAAVEGVTPEEFMRALFLRWLRNNWRELDIPNK